MTEQAAILLESMALALAVSVDAFAAGFSYGVGGIRIPVASAGVVNLICSGVLGLSLLFGEALQEIIAPHTASMLAFGILLVMGLLKVFEKTGKRYLLHRFSDAPIVFSAMEMKFILQVYVDPQRADTDASKSLSAREALSLAAALSLDSLVVGIGAALGSVGIWEAVLGTFFFGLTALLLGAALGSRITEGFADRCACLGGILLILLAFARL